MRLLVLSQLDHIPKNGNYTEDDSIYFLNFIKQKEVEKAAELAVTEDDELIGEVSVRDVVDTVHEFEDQELVAFAYLCGWLVYAEVKKGVCQLCKAKLTSGDGQSQSENDLVYIFIKYKEFGKLQRPSIEVVHLIKKFDTMFNLLINDHEKDKELHEMLMTSTRNIAQESLFTCCHVAESMARRYVKFKLHLHGKERTLAANANNSCPHSSRSEHKKFKQHELEV